MIGAVSRDFRQSSMNYAGYARAQQQQPQQPRQQGGDLPATNMVNQAENKGDNKGGNSNLNEKYRCHTCENRTYMDGSDDPGVSMKTPTKVNPMAAASAVMSHEREHVTRNAFKAQAEGRRVISSSVTIHTGVCGECGKTYVAGGTTRTVTAGKDWGKPTQPEDGQQLNMRI